jgi:transcriptional regulator with XRE-family HTH domain
MHDEHVNESEALETIGHLIKKGRLEMGLAQKPFAIKAEVDAKTLSSMEKGTRVAWETNQRKVEHALNWRLGSIQSVIDNAADIPAGSVTLASMREGAAEATWQELDAEETAKREGPVTRANQLTDEELLAELAYRFRNYKNVIDGQT